MTPHPMNTFQSSAGCEAVACRTPGDCGSHSPTDASTEYACSDPDASSCTGSEDSWSARSPQCIGRPRAHMRSASGSSVELEKGWNARGDALEVQPGTVKRIAFTPRGSRMVQKFLEAANPVEAAALASELKGSVVAAIQCPHANHVLQMVFKTLPPSAWPTFFVE